MSSIDEIKSRLNIVDIVSESVQLRRTGKNYSGLCPFHPNTRTPAFAIFPDTGTWRCFGECNDGGDVFKFVMKKEGWDFPETLSHLAERAGVQLRPQTPQEIQASEENELIHNVLEEAALFFHHQLINSKSGEKALRYLENRGLNEETIETFGLGFALPSWDALNNYFRTKNHPSDLLLSAGLIAERDSGGYYDRFRDRIIFPIRDDKGRMTGFGGRVLNPDDIPKFLNSPQTMVFDKGKLLYGLNLAKRKIRSQDQVIIVEGYLDVIVPHQHGYKNIVSPMGTALTDNQIRLLKKLTRNIVLALDSDAAGVRATLRGLQIARNTLDREGDISFDARGLLRHESRLQADIRVTTLPDEMDPDDVINRDPKEWERIVANAKPIVIHVMDTLSTNRNIDDPKVKIEIAEQIRPLIEDLPSSIERDTYYQKLARLLKIDERALFGSDRGRRSFRKPRRQKYRSPQEETNQSSRKQLYNTGVAREIYCLGVLLRNPELIYQVDRKLQENGLHRINQHDFQNSEHQAILRIIQKSLNQLNAEPLDSVLDSIPIELMGTADEVLASTEKINPNNFDTLEDCLRALLDIRRRNIRQLNNYYRYLLVDEEDSEKKADYQKNVHQNIIVMQRLDIAVGQFTNHSITSE